MTAVVAGAMTTGIGAANVIAVPEQADPAEARLAAFTIPIVDIDQTVGPLTVIRRLALTLGATPNEIFGSLFSQAGTIYDLPGLYANFTSSGEQTLSALRDPGDSIRFGFDSQGPENNYLVPTWFRGWLHQPQED